MFIGFKINALIKALPNEQKDIYKRSIDECKKNFLDKSAKHLPKDKVAEFLLMLEID